MKTSVKQNFILNLIKTFVTVLYPIIAFKYVSNILGVDNVGRVQFAQSVISYFALFAGLGISSYAVREGGKIRNDRHKLTKLFKELFRINLFTMAIVMIVLFIFIQTGILHKDVTLLWICSLSIIFTTLSVEWINQICEDYLYISIRTIIFQLTALLLIFLLVHKPSDVNIYAFLICFGNGGYFLFNLMHLPKYINVHEKIKLNYRKHLKPILIIFGLSVSTSIYVNLDTVILGFMKNNYEVGLYSAAIKVLTALKAFSAAITAVVLPKLALFASEKDQHESFTELIKYAFDLNMLFIIPCSIALLTLSGPVLLFLSGPKFLPAIPASQLLAINLLFAITNGILCFQVLLSFNEEKYAAFATTIGAIANLVLNLLIIPHYGFVGAAFTTVLSEALVFIIFLLRVKNYLSITILFKGLLKIFIASIIAIVPVSWILLMLMSSHQIIVLLLCLVICPLIYLFVILKFKVPIAVNIKNDVINLLGKMKK